MCLRINPSAEWNLKSDPSYITENRKITCLKHACIIDLQYYGEMISYYFKSLSFEVICYAEIKKELGVYSKIHEIMC
jgi:hypothetical protein